MDLVPNDLVKPIFSQSLPTPQHTPQPRRFLTAEQRLPKKNAYLMCPSWHSSVALYKCCTNSCIAELTASDIEACSALYAGLNKSQQTTFIVQTMSACCVKRLPSSFRLRVNGTAVCVAAFLKVL